MAMAISHPQAGAFRLPSTPLDAPRIVGQAGAIAINAALLMALMVPLNVPMPATLPEPGIEAVFLPREKPKPVEITTEKPRPSATTTHPRPSAPTRPAAVDPVVATQPDDLVAPIQPDVADAFDDGIARVDPPGGGMATAMQLQALSSPAPPYPPQAIRDGLAGTVLLEIVVGTDGRPLEVTIVRSSGHRVLDQAARRTVLTRWTFQPAMRDGQPVQAIGRVPIDFVMQR